MKIKYFPHDLLARNDQKVLLLRSKFKSAGYGVYMMLTEKLHEAENNQIKISDMASIAFEFSEEYEFVMQVIDCCIEAKLLVFSEDRTSIFSERVCRNVAFFAEKNSKRSIAGKKGNEVRWAKKAEKKQEIEVEAEIEEIHEVEEVFEVKMKNPMKSKPKVKTGTKTFFDETDFATDFDFFSNNFSLRFPDYGKYDLLHYYKGMQNWGGGSRTVKYKKADWLLTAKTWIDKDVADNKIFLKSSSGGTLPKVVEQGNRVTDELIKKYENSKFNDEWKIK